MIQAVNSVKANNYQTARQQSFGHQAPAEIIDYKPQEMKKPNKRSKLATVAGYLATQFAAGAVFSGIWDGGINLYRLARKNKPLLSLKEMGPRAAVLGGMFVLCGLIFTGIDAAMSARRSKASK